MPQHVALLLDDLLGGGAARVAVHLANAWAGMGRQVTLLTGDDGGIPAVYELHPAVQHRPLAFRGDSRNTIEALLRNFRRILRLRRALRELRPDVLISFLDSNNVLCLLATRGMDRLPILISERTDPSGRSIGFFWESMRRFTYPWADCLVVQSAHALTYFTPGIQAKGRVIPNPVSLPAGTEPPTGFPRKSRYLVVTLGRLNKVKGHDLLIEAFAALAAPFPDWDLAIYGEGEEREALKSRIDALGLGTRIFLKGATGQVGDRLREADLFVLPSRTEGFPNALAEAMACGLPVVSFDCHSGPSELIRKGVDGVLVPPLDVPALSRAMAQLMDSPRDRVHLGANAREVLQRFSAASVFDQWESAIQSATQAARRR